MANIKSELYSVPNKGADFVRVELAAGESLAEELNVTPQGLEILVRSKTEAPTTIKVTRPFAMTTKVKR